MKLEEQNGSRSPGSSYHFTYIPDGVLQSLLSRTANGTDKESSEKSLFPWPKDWYGLTTENLVGSPHPTLANTNRKTVPLLYSSTPVVLTGLGKGLIFHPTLLPHGSRWQYSDPLLSGAFGVKRVIFHPLPGRNR